MPDPAPHKQPYAGGVLIVLGVVVGCIAGLATGQPTPGVLIGGATGIALAVALWWRGRG